MTDSMVDGKKVGLGDAAAAASRTTLSGAPELQSDGEEEDGDSKGHEDVSSGSDSESSVDMKPAMVAFSLCNSAPPANKAPVKAAGGKPSGTGSKSSAGVKSGGGGKSVGSKASGSKPSNGGPCTPKKGKRAEGGDVETTLQNAGQRA